MQYFRSSRRCCWGFMSSGVWRRVVERAFSDVSKVRCSLHFRIKQYKKKWCFTLEDEGATIFRNVWNHWQKDTASHPSNYPLFRQSSCGNWRRSFECCWAERSVTAEDVSLRVLSPVQCVCHSAGLWMSFVSLQCSVEPFLFPCTLN